MPVSAAKTRGRRTLTLTAHDAGRRPRPWLTVRSMQERSQLCDGKPHKLNDALDVGGGCEADFDPG